LIEEVDDGDDDESIEDVVIIENVYN